MGRILTLRIVAGLLVATALSAPAALDDGILVGLGEQLESSIRLLEDEGEEAR